MLESHGKKHTVIRRVPPITWLFFLLFLLQSLSSAQTLKVLHNFGGPGDGLAPAAGLIVDNNGNLYGTTANGGNYGESYCSCYGCGIVFELTPQPDGSWNESIIHAFHGGDGAFPGAPVVLDGSGVLYGTAAQYGRYPYGNVFQMTPSSNGMWAFSVLHDFTGGWDGAYPVAAVTLDSSGNLYSTTQTGGIHYFGTAFSLSNRFGGWSEIVLHPFGNGMDGQYVYSALTADHDGSLYGTAFYGGANQAGTVFTLTRNVATATWNESVLYSFTGTSGGSGLDGANPDAGVVFDDAGNLYGTTLYGGPAGWGTVFKLSPQSDGTWIESVLYSFSGDDGVFPNGPLILDNRGNLYGTTIEGGTQGSWGTIFELTPSGGQWTETVLHSFSMGQDGGTPEGGLMIDRTGNLYGTTALGGEYSGGIAFEFVPQS